MIHPIRTSGALVALLLSLCASGAHADERVAGTVVSIQDDLVVIELGDEPAVGEGSVLMAWRRLPGARGSAAYRDAGAWWEVAEVTVVQVSGGLAIGRRSGDPSLPVPAALDESGAPAEAIQVGDRLRATGAIGERSLGVRVTFPREELFAEEAVELADDGQKVLRSWLRGLKSMELPIRVEVHARMEELGGEAPDLARSLSADEDAPFGPAPGDPVVPVEGLQGSAALPATPPPAVEVMVVDGASARGRPDVWRYMDPVTVARRRGERIAAALAAHLGIGPELVVVQVVPRGISASFPYAAGYDRPGDQVRILASGMDWSDPGDLPRPRPAEVKPAIEPDERGRRRRLLEKMPAEVSALTSTAPPDPET